MMSDNQPKLQPERIKSFVISMILDAFNRANQDNVDLRIKVREAINDIFNTILGIESHSEEDIKIGIDSIIEGILTRNVDLIDRLQKQVDFAQVRLNYQQHKLQEEIQLAVEILETISETQPEPIQEMIHNAIEKLDIRA